MWTCEIVGCRHPEKDGDEITAKGAMQAWAAAEALMANQHFVPDTMAYSGAVRTLQAAKVMAAAMGVTPKPEKHSEFHFQVVFEKHFPGTEGRDEFFRLKQELDRKNSGQATLAQALAAGGKIQLYAEEGREAMREAIIHLAMRLRGGSRNSCLILSHSPWIELAYLDPAGIPFGLGEADAIGYVVSAPDDAAAKSEFQISASILIPAPLPGKGSYK